MQFALKHSDCARSLRSGRASHGLQFPSNARSQELPNCQCASRSYVAPHARSIRHRRLDAPPTYTRGRHKQGTLCIPSKRLRIHATVAAMQHTGAVDQARRANGGASARRRPRCTSWRLIDAPGAGLHIFAAHRRAGRRLSSHPVESSRHSHIRRTRAQPVASSGRSGRLGHPSSAEELATLPRKATRDPFRARRATGPRDGHTPLQRPPVPACANHHTGPARKRTDPSACAANTCEPRHRCHVTAAA